MKILNLGVFCKLQLFLHFQERRGMDSRCGHTLYCQGVGMGFYGTTYEILILGTVPCHFLSQYN